MRPHVHNSLPLSFKITPRRCPRNRESAAVTASRSRRNRAGMIFFLLATLGPVILAAVIRWLAP